MKKVLLSLLALTLVFAMTSCKDSSSADNESVSQENESVAEDKIYEEGLSFLPDSDYDNYTFTFFVRNGGSSSIIPDDPTANIVTEATYNRNEYVKNRFNINFATVEASSSGYETEAMNTILAGDDAYDVILPHGRAALVYAMKGVLLDWNEDLIYCDLTKPWWSQDIIKSFAVTGKLYCMDGDLGLGSLSATHCLLFNKNICDELEIEYPYQLVRDGEWTLDKLIEYSNLAVKDLDGDGVITDGVDRVGYVTNQWSGPLNVIYTAGLKVFEINEEGIPEISIYSQKTVELFEKYFDFLSTDAAYCTSDYGYYGKSNVSNMEIFKSDKTLFYTAIMGDVGGFRDMESDYGVLPLAKYSLEDEYATIVDGASSLICVPITASDPLRTSAILEALTIVGSRDVVPAYYNKSLQTKYARDDESEEMLDLIKATRVYDLAYLYGGGLSNIGTSLMTTTTPDFASFYAKNEQSALAAIDAMIEAFNK